MTHNSYMDQRPYWSQDGRRLLFASLRTAYWEAYEIDTIGHNERPLGYVLAQKFSPEMNIGPYLAQNYSILPIPGEWWPSRSPDGETIAYNESRGDLPNIEIYVWNGPERREQQLTKTRPGVLNTNAAWSPDGKRIAFQSNRDGNWEIYVMNANGAEQTRLTFSRWDDEFPTWSPDGRWIAFESNREMNREIFVMKADGANLVQLTKSRGGNRWPAWSPR